MQDVDGEIFVGVAFMDCVQCLKVFAKCVWGHTAVGVEVAERRALEPLKLDEACGVRLNL